MMNKPLAIIVTVFGVAMSIFFGVYVMFCQGILDILSHTTVVDNKLVVDMLWLILGGVKMVLAPTVFSFIMNTTALTAYKLWREDEETQDNS